VAVVTVAGGGETGRAVGSSASSASNDLGKSGHFKEKGEKADIETESARARSRQADEDEWSKLGVIRDDGSDEGEGVSLRRTINSSERGVVSVVRPSTAAAFSTAATAASGIMYARDGASRVWSGPSRAPGSIISASVTASTLSAVRGLAARPVCIIKSTL